MDNKQKHITYWKKQGRFIIDCNTDAFSSEEIEILKKWGNWFKALCDEKLTPFTMLQEQFISVAKGEQEPFSMYEVAWDKYLETKNNESKAGDAQDREYLPYEDTFYNRNMVKKQRGMIFGVMKGNHRI
jgi:uncharacterized protein YifE (UPF0438 family)